MIKAFLKYSSSKLSSIYFLIVSSMAGERFENSKRTPTSFMLKIIE